MKKFFNDKEINVENLKIEMSKMKTFLEDGGDLDGYDDEAVANVLSIMEELEDIEYDELVYELSDGSNWQSIAYRLEH